MLWLTIFSIFSWNANIKIVAEMTDLITTVTLVSIKYSAKAITSSGMFRVEIGAFDCQSFYKTS